MKTVRLTEKERDAIWSALGIWVNDGVGFETCNHGKISQKEVKKLRDKFEELGLEEK